MHIFKQVHNKIISSLKELEKSGFLPNNSDFSAVTAEPPRDSSHGDVATNAAMVLAKPSGKNPRVIAEELIKILKNDKDIEHIEIAGPGFINIRLNKNIWLNEVLTILEEEKGYGNSDIGGGQKVNIEYVSANPTGPMHIGHARGAVFGDALALLMFKAGYDVTKEYYINDAGAQVDVLAKSAHLRYREALGENIGAIPEGLYPGQYLKIAGETLAAQYGRDLLDMDEEKALPIIKKSAIESMLTLIKKDLSDLGIHHDVFTSEKAIQEAGKIEKSMKILEAQGLLYRGILEPPKGKLPDDWEPREQTLFRSTDFGDDVDRALMKSDGSYTYFASDIAYHLDKFERGFTKMILVLGADHGGYVKRLKSCVSAVSGGKAEADIKISQLVNLLEDGTPVKMSKRAGNFATVRDVLDEVGKDVIRFIMLTRKNDAVLDFDLKIVKEQSKDNPIFYVQYAVARAKSVLRNAMEQAPKAYEIYKKSDKKLMESIDLEDELKIIKLMASWPRIVESAAIASEPHRVAFYLQELAAEFHSLWNKGKENTILRFIIEDKPELTAARLAYLDAMTKVIASGLFIFNIEAVNEM